MLSIGNNRLFAIKSALEVPCTDPGLIGLGYFVLYIKGQMYGVREKQATHLACSLDAVKSRVERRGTHVPMFSFDLDAFQIASAVRNALYLELIQDETFFGYGAADFVSELHKRHLIWAPDGDQAFDDGSHVLQFEESDVVRLIAFKNLNELEFASSIKDVVMDATHYYGILTDWVRRFEMEWERYNQGSSSSA